MRNESSEVALDHPWTTGSHHAKERMATQWFYNPEQVVKTGYLISSRLPHVAHWQARGLVTCEQCMLALKLPGHLSDSDVNYKNAHQQPSSVHVLPSFECATAMTTNQMPHIFGFGFLLLRVRDVCYSSIFVLMLIPTLYIQTEPQCHCLVVVDRSIGG